MSVDAHAARPEERDHGVDRGTPPVGLRLAALRILRVRAAPVLLGVLVACGEARRVRVLLERAPVERDGRGVEQPVLLSVQRLVAVVPLLLPELVEVEDVRTEEERVRDLLDLHLRAVRRRDLDGRVGLAVLLDVRVDPRLHVVVPDPPVGVAHHGAVHPELRGRAKRHHGRGSSNNLLHSDPLSGIHVKIQPVAGYCTP